MHSAMSREVKLKTLPGDIYTHRVDSDTTVEKLKAMLLEHKTKDPIERKILRVELLQDCSVMVDDAQDLGKTGLLEAEAVATVIYKRNEVEAATGADVHTQGLFHLNIPPDLKTISGSAFQDCTSLVSVTITKSVTHIGNYSFFCCFSLAKITLGDSVEHIGENAFANCASLSEHHFGWLCDAHWRQCLSKLHLSWEHHFWWLCDAHWGECLSKLHLSCEHHFGWLYDAHWGQCLSKLRLSSESHCQWLCDTHWGQCLWRLPFFVEHYFWMTLWRTFWTMRFETTPLWQAYLFGESV